MGLEWQGGMEAWTRVLYQASREGLRADYNFMLKARRVKAACVMDLDSNPKLVPELAWVSLHRGYKDLSLQKLWSVLGQASLIHAGLWRTEGQMSRERDRDRDSLMWLGAWPADCGGGAWNGSCPSSLPCPLPPAQPPWAVNPSLCPVSLLCWEIWGPFFENTSDRCQAIPTLTSVTSFEW